MKAPRHLHQPGSALSPATKEMALLSRAAAIANELADALTQSQQTTGPT
jgi:hypothetical protein